MKISKIVCLAIPLMLLSGPPTNAAPRRASSLKSESGYKRYCNEKFGYCIDYPSNLTGSGEPDAHDGQTFSSDSQPLRMSVWGAFNNWMDGNEMTIQQEKDWTCKNLASDNLPAPKITYQAQGKSWFVISGTSKENIFYRRTIRTKDTFVTVLFIYPATEKEKLASMVTRVALSLQG